MKQYPGVGGAIFEVIYHSLSDSSVVQCSLVLLENMFLAGREAFYIYIPLSFPFSAYLTLN